MIPLILSCITKGPDQTRLALDALGHAGIPSHAIVVLHPGDSLTTPTEHRALGSTQPVLPSPMRAAASGGATGGMFGWLLGYGVLSLPGAILGGAVGALAGVGVGITHQILHHLSDEVQHHYAHRIVDDHAAILVRVEDATQYQTVLDAFLEQGGRHILTSRNNCALAESDQLDAIVHHPEMLGDVVSPTRAAAEEWP